MLHDPLLGLNTTFGNGHTTLEYRESAKHIAEEKEDEVRTTYKLADHTSSDNQSSLKNSRIFYHQVAFGGHFKVH